MKIDRILRKYTKSIELERGYSAHSMRATCITSALDNGASLEDRAADGGCGPHSPRPAEAIPLMPEPIIKQDGTTQIDCISPLSCVFIQIGFHMPHASTLPAR
jgi:hypothetical protein